MQKRKYIAERINRLSSFEELKNIVAVELNITELHEMSEWCLKLISEVEGGSSMIGNKE